MTEKWGPTWWSFLHNFAATYPCAPCAADRRAAHRLVESVAALLPCPRCKAHFQALLKRTPVDVRGRRALAEWMWAAHNEVNRRLGKPEMELEEALATVEPCAESAVGEAPASFERGCADARASVAAAVAAAVVGLALVGRWAVRRARR